jgi:hypothetical protein
MTPTLPSAGAGLARQGQSGLRPIHRPDYYAASPFDLDGNPIKAVHHTALKKKD